MASTSSPSTPASKAINQDVLSRIQHLDVTKNIQDRSRTSVAYGGYSEVFTGRLRRVGNERVDVAIKRLRFHVGEEKALKVRPLALAKEFHLMRFVQQFAKEVYVWSKLSHPNILPLLGFAFCKETRFPLLVSEWMHLGTAWSYVQENPGLSLLNVAILVCAVYHIVAVPPS